MEDPIVSKERSSAEILKMLRESMCNNVDTVPPGYYTMARWAKEWKFKPSQTRRLLLSGIKCGTIEQKAFRIHVSKVLTRKVMHYRAKPESKG